MSAFARSSQINFIGWPSPSSWMITGHSSCDIHSGSGLAAVSCVRRSPSRIWRTRRREQPRAVAISRTLRPSARRRLISSCLSTVSFLPAMQLSRACSGTTVRDCTVNGPKPGFGGQGRKTDRRRRRRSHDRGAPGSKVPWKIDHSVLPSPFRSWNLAMRKSTPLRVEKRLRPVVPLGRNRVGPLPRNRVVPFRRNQVGPFRRNPAPSSRALAVPADRKVSIDTIL